MTAFTLKKDHTRDGHGRDMNKESILIDWQRRRAQMGYSIAESGFGQDGSDMIETDWLVLMVYMVK
jgi:hypothetical protein